MVSDDASARQLSTIRSSPSTPCVATYIERIRNCYHNYQEAFRFYENLVDYMNYPKGRSPNNRWHQKLQQEREFAIHTCPLHSVQNDAAAGWEPGRNWFTRCEPDEACNCPRIFLLEGFPSPDRIAALGSRLNVRPEVFLAFLDMSRKQGNEFFEQPPLPSTRWNIVEIRSIFLVKSLVGTVTSESNAERRISTNKAHERSEKALFTDKQYGEARYRKINVHNTQYCSFEQSLFLSVTRDKSTRWNCLILSDQGRSAMSYRGFPWNTCSENKPEGTLPIVPYGLIDSEDRNAGITASTGETKLGHPLKHVMVQDGIDAELLIHDPSFLLFSCLKFSAMSWNQFINFVKQDVKQYEDAALPDFDDAIQQLRYDIDLIDHTSSCVAQNLATIDNSASEAWQHTTDSKLKLRRDVMIKQLRNDHEALLQNCSVLSRACERKAAMLVSAAQLADTQKNMQLALQVHNLSLIATAFIPLSVVAGVFSMSVKELEDPPSIWAFFVASVAILMLIYSLLYRHLIWENRLLMWERLKELWRWLTGAEKLKAPTRD